MWARMQYDRWNKEVEEKLSKSNEKNEQKIEEKHETKVLAVSKGKKDNEMKVESDLAEL